MKFRLAGSESWRTVVAATLESLGVAAWEWDTTTSHVWWSENFGPLVGRPRGYAPSSFDDAFSVFTPVEGRPADPAALLEYLSGVEGPLEVERSVILPGGATKWMLHRYAPVRGVDGSVKAVYGLVIDIDERKRREIEESLLLEAGKALSASIDLDQTLAAVAHLMVPDFADWCVLELAVDDRLEVVVNAHVDPDKVRWAEAIQAEYPVDMASPVGSPNVLRTGQPEFYPDIPDEMLQGIAAGDERMLEILRNVGYRSVMIVPVVARRRVIGTLTLVTAESGRRFDERSVRFAERLASHIGPAIDNARLHQEIERRGAQLGRLYSVASRLSAAVGLEAATDLTVQVVLDAVAADRGALARRVDDDSIGIVGHVGLAIERPGSSPATSRDLIGVAFQEPVFVLVPHAQDSAALAAVLGTDEPSPGMWALLPVPRSTGTPDLLMVCFDDPDKADDAVQEVLVATAEQVGVALDRAHLLSRYRRIAHTLQEGLQPAQIPHLPGIASASIYEPTGRADAGGDWFDVFETGDGSVAVVVGDIAGHGIPAVAAMAQLRHTLAAHLHAGHGPAESVELANKVMLGVANESVPLATAIVCLIAPDRSHMVMCRAGHPPAVLSSAGTTSLVDIAPGPPVGSVRSATWEDRRVKLEPGALLVLYTDGWVDRPGADLDLEFERLRTVVAAAGAEPALVVGRVAAAFRDPDRRDDAAVLAVRIGRSDAVDEGGAVPS